MNGRYYRMRIGKQQPKLMQRMRCHNKKYKVTFCFFQILILVILITACNSNKKYFTGTVDYAYTYTSDSLNTDSLALTRPVKSNFRYDESNYQSRFTGKDTQVYYYSGIVNKCVGKINNDPDYTCEDYSLATDSILSWKVYDTDEKILGYDCRILEIQKTTSWVKYYVAKKLIIAPVTYQKHKSYNWNFYGEKSNGGLILKLEHRFKRFTMKGVATNVVIEKTAFRALEISDSLFSTVCK